MKDDKPPNPEDLLKMLDLQIQLQRNKRQLQSAGPSKGVMWLIGMLVFLVVSLFSMYLLLQLFSEAKNANPKREQVSPHLPP